MSASTIPKDENPVTTSLELEDNGLDDFTCDETPQAVRPKTNVVMATILTILFIGLISVYMIFLARDVAGSVCTNALTLPLALALRT